MAAPGDTFTLTFANEKLPKALFDVCASGTKYVDDAYETECDVFA